MQASDVQRLPVKSKLPVLHSVPHWGILCSNPEMEAGWLSPLGAWGQTQSIVIGPVHSGKLWIAPPSSQLCLHGIRTKNEGFDMLDMVRWQATCSVGQDMPCKKPRTGA